MKRNVKLRFGGSVSLRSGKWALRLIPALGLLFSASTLRAADSPGVKFNSGVRYSQWAINSRLYDFRGNQNKFGFAKWDASTQKLGTYDNWASPKNDYVAGLVGKAAIEAAEYYNTDWSKPWFESAKGYALKVQYSSNVDDPKSITLDNMNAAKMFIPLTNGNSEWISSTEQSSAKNCISEVIKDLVKYNSNLFIGSAFTYTKDKITYTGISADEATKLGMYGSWYHKPEYVDQTWCDGMYMGPALLAQIVKYNGNTNNLSAKENDWDILARQFTISWKQLYNESTGLLYHGFTANPKVGASASWEGITKGGTTYHSASFWGRANAWYLMALVDVLEVMPEENKNYATLKGYLDKLATGIANHQDKTTGCWYQVLDKTSTTLTGNYLEASCSSIFTAAYLKAIRLGLLNKVTYEPVATKAYEGLVNQFMVYDNKDNNTIQLVKSCTSAGLGGKNSRKGDDNYYLTGTDAGVVTSATIGNSYYYTEGKVLGGFIMAATEYERAYQNQDQNSKQILFAKDLAPQYDFSTTAGSLDATAYGTGAEKATYQWYKDGNAVDKATSATYTPTENGKYYCIAKAGNNTIQTSTTTVTAKAATEGGDNNSGETTAPSGTATFKIDDLKLLDSAPSGNEKSELVDGNITIKAGKKISWDTKNNGLKIGKKDQSTFSIIANNNAKIKKVIITQTDNNRELNYNPAGSKSSNDKVFTYDYSKTKPSEITVSYNTGGNIYVTNIVVEYENEIVKTNLTASFSQTTIYATEGDASVGVPPLTVKAGDKPFTEYTLSDYTTTDANVAKVENGKVVFVGKGTTTISVNVIPNNTTLYNGCKAEFTVNVKEKTVTPVEPTETRNVYDFKTNVGTTTSGNTAIEVTADKIVFGANYKPAEGKYITITPANGGFKAGDLITITGRSTKGNARMTLNSTLDSETSEQYLFNALGTTETTYQYLLQADCSVLYLGRASGSTATITGLTVTRAAAAENKPRLVATFPSNSITVVNTTKTTTLPTLTVKAGDTELTNEQYTVKKESDNKAVATIEGDIITIKGIGTATVFATITPVDQTKYEGCIATYQVTVKEPTPLAISTMDVTMNTVDAEVKQPIIKVYGDNDKLLTLGKDYTLSYNVVEGTNVSVSEAGVFSVTRVDEYNWTAGTSKVTVTATPTTTLGNTYTAGTLTFEYNVVKGKITPVFLEAFKDKIINVKNGSTKTFSVPLIYDGEDVSNYFVYTYTINGTAAASTNVEGNTLTFSKTTGEYKIDVTATPNTGKEGDDTDDYSEVYNNPEGISFTVNVGNFTRPTVIVDPSSMTMYTGSREEAADVTVMNGKDIMTEDKYKLQWISFTPGVVKVDENGNLEAVSEGTGLVHVVVTGDGLESMSTLLKVFVDDPALYRVKKTDNAGNSVKYGNQRIMWNQDKTMSVSLGGWMFPNEVKVTNGTTTEALSKTNAWDNDASQAKWKLTGFDNVVLSEKSQNARQENGSNAMPESADLYDATFVNKGTVVDKMFNVPCAGSYLAFNPATNGVVRVHIFQSGAFDSANGKYQYRPQRRVFVMDEAGNFVKSSAEIENANGKPKGGVQALNKYKWDLKKYAAPTSDEVRKHFPKLPTSFDMTDADFQNNVMESGLENSVVPNNVPTNHKDEPGANGWCVLADSPVTYSFRVKAGKTYYLYNFGSKIGFYGYSFEEDATKPTVDEVKYDENATDNKIESTPEGHVAKVSINRSFTAGVWSTCVLPFSLNMSQVDAIFGDTYRFGNENGTEILYFDRVDENGKVWFVRHAYNTIVANKPFLIKPTKDVNGINTVDCAEYPYVIIEAPKNNKPADWCSDGKYAWVSSYNNDMTLSTGDGYIGGTSGNFIQSNKDGVKVKGFRGFLKGLTPAAKTHVLSTMTASNTDGDGNTTFIDGLVVDGDGNFVPTATDGKVYSINGQLVGKDMKSLGSLPSGVYIINGKKYIK